MDNNKYVVVPMKYDDLKGNLEVPKYQRRLVWSKKQKTDFVETLRQGYPFGAILLHELKESTLDEKKYALVDGLQRITTILDFENRPIEYLKLHDLRDDLYNLFGFEGAAERTKSKYLTDCYDIILKYITYRTDSKSRSSVLYTIIREEYNALINSTVSKLGKLLETSEYDTVEDTLLPFEEKIRQRLDEINLENLVIPTIIFKGDETELSDVFYNLNIGGKKLSRYQVFSARWFDKEIKLNSNTSGNYDKDLMNIIVERYDSLNDLREIEIMDYDSSELRRKMIINLPEFCYALGVLILEKLPAFYTTKKSLLDQEDTANEIGYSTVAITMGLSNRKMHELLNFHSFFEDGSVVNDYVKKVLDIYYDINQIFSSKLIYRTTENNHQYATGGITNFMLLSYFSSLWNVKHEKTSEKITNKSGYKTDYNKILNNLISYFIDDQTTDYWSGTGDTKLDQIVERNRYLGPVPKDQLESNLLKYVEERSNSANIQFDSLTKTIITLLNNYEENLRPTSKYDFEHILPRVLLTNLYRLNKIGAGSLGNCMLLEHSHNRRKQAMTLYDSLEENQKYDNEFLRKINYPSNIEIDMMIANIKNKQNLDEVNKFIEKRSKALINQLLIKLYG